MNQPLHIVVTQKHINNGELFDSHHCPIALAVAEMYPGLIWEVDYDCIYATDPLDKALHVTRKAWNLPDNAQLFISSYDASKHVKPITFDATPWPPIQELIRDLQ